MDITVKQLEVECPEVYQAVFEQGRQAEKERFSELLKTCGEDHELFEQSFLSDAGLESIRDARIQSLEKTNAEQKRILEEAEARELTDSQLKENFANSQKLQDEFHSADSYVAYIRHSKECTIIGGKVVTG